MSDDKMRADFEAVARREGWSLRPCKGDPNEYWSEDTGVWWQWWQAAYQAGRKAEREAIEKQSSPLVQFGLELQGKPEGEG